MLRCLRESRGSRDRLAEHPPEHRDLPRVVEAVLDLTVDEHVPRLRLLPRRARSQAAQLRDGESRDLAAEMRLGSRETLERLLPGGGRTGLRDPPGDVVRG